MFIMKFGYDTDELIPNSYQCAKESMVFKQTPFFLLCFEISPLIMQIFQHKNLLKQSRSQSQQQRKSIDFQLTRCKSWIWHDTLTLKRLDSFNCANNNERYPDQSSDHHQESAIPHLRDRFIPHASYYSYQNRAGLFHKGASIMNEKV